MHRPRPAQPVEKRLSLERGSRLQIGATRGDRSLGLAISRAGLPDPSSRRDVEIAGKPHQIGNRVRFHLLQDLMTVELDGSLRDSEIVPNLFVQLAADEMSENLSLPSR